MKKKWLVVFISALLSFMICQPVMAASSKKAIQATVKSFFAAVKKYDAYGIANTMQPKEDRDYFTAFDDSPNIAKAVKKMHKDYLKFKIQKITVKGNTATAKTKITFFNAHGRAAINIVLHLALADEFNMNEVGQLLYTEYSKLTKKEKKEHVVTKTVSIPMVKKSGKWLIKTPTAEIKHVIDCGIADALEFISE